MKKLAALAAPVLLAACSGGGDEATSASSTAPPTSSASSTSSTPSATSSSATPTPSTSSPTSTPSTNTNPPTPSSTPPAAGGCVQRLADGMTPAQRSGQLIMVGLQSGASPASLDDEIADLHLGNVFFIGGWNGAGSVRTVTRHVQAQAGRDSTRGVKFLISADQEGGQVQQLKGSGFSDLPSALRQGSSSTTARTRVGATIGRELRAVGVNINLAPVADVVPAGTAGSNAPIGRFHREYGSSPTVVSTSVADVIEGMQGQGVLATLKHFPGIGRIRNNTDFSATGITDAQTTATGPFLRPFAAGIAQQPGMVMVSSARYAKIDGSNPAIFSGAVINGTLRSKLHWNGVVVSDDLNAVAVRGVPASQRGIRMVRAGGDIALTGSVSGARSMASAMTALAAKDPTFDKQLRASVVRVLELKTRMGLTPCSVA